MSRINHIPAIPELAYPGCLYGKMMVYLPT